MTEKDIEKLRTLSREIDDLYGKGKSEEAQEKLQEALEISKDTDEAYYLFFQGKKAAYLENDFEQQGVLFDKAIELRPDDPFLLCNKALTLSEKGNEEEAIKYFDKALAIKPDDYHSLRGKGVSLSEKGLFDEGIACFDKALAIKPDDYHSLNDKVSMVS